MDPLPSAFITLFGITGDLANRYVLPAIYYMRQNSQLSDDSRLIGVTRRGTTVDEVIEGLRQHIADELDPAIVDWFRRATSIVTMDLSDPEAYGRLRQHLDQLEDATGHCTERLFYLSIPAPSVAEVARHLSEQRLMSGCQHGASPSRLLLEKPFGYDLASAQALHAELSQHVDESQLYRIDHYVAKAATCDLLRVRREPAFADMPPLESLSIRSTEAIGIEGRTVFYEPMGALRDIIQSHLLQLAATMIVDPSSEDIHSAKRAVLDQIHLAGDAETASIRAQYVSYCTEVNNPKSQTETFAALNLAYQDAPISVITGKALSEKRTEMRAVYCDETAAYQLIVTVQPDPVTRLFRLREQGDDELIYEYIYRDDAHHSRAYERVLAGAIRGDHALFATADEVLSCWRISQPILDAWRQGNPPLQRYQWGSQGPDGIERFIAAPSASPAVSPMQVLEEFDLQHLPNLDVVVLAALELFTQQPLPRIDVSRYRHPLVVGSGNAEATGRIVFEQSEAVFASESTFEAKLRQLPDIDSVVLISASGAKHAPLIAEVARALSKPVTLLTNTPDSAAHQVLDLGGPDSEYVFPKNREPYTYNTSTYMGMILAMTGEDPAAISQFLQEQIASLPFPDFSSYDKYYLIVPPQFSGIIRMLEVKFIELFGRNLARDVETSEYVAHATTVAPAHELFICFGEPNTVWGEPQNRLNVPLPDNAGYGAMMAVGYFVIAQIQKAYPHFFKDNIAAYTAFVSEVFGQTISPIVEN